MTKKIFKLHKDEKGASMLEYALLASLIAMVCVASLGVMGQQSNATFGRVGIEIEAATQNITH